MMNFHPLADVLPLIEGDGFKELVSDIKAHGLHDPITTLDQQILDGRNRYRACLEAGVEPRFVPFDGEDPMTFVIAKNLYRRHLNAGQRAMALAKYATITNGRPCRDKTTGQPVVIKTIPEVAAMAGVNKATVSDARTIYANGTTEEVASVVSGNATITSVARAVRDRRQDRDDLRTGPRIMVPEGRLITDVVREGIKLELGGGGRPAVIARRIGVGVQTYNIVRDALLLSDRDDLSRKDAETVKNCLAEINSTQRVHRARKTITPIALRVWGPRGLRLKNTDERRAKQFDNAIEFLKHTCESAIDMVVPHITRSHAETAIRQLSDAEASLRKLKGRIKGGQHG